MSFLTCAITGHRFASLPFGTNESKESCVRLKNAIHTALTDLIENAGVTRFLCGMALGADQICAEAVLSLRPQFPAIRLICIIPCAEQSRKWSRAQKMRYQRLLLDSDQTICLSERYTPDCMQKRNRLMVDEADVLLAIWNKLPRGGTAATVRYAKAKGIPIRLIDPNAFCD